MARDACAACCGRTAARTSRFLVGRSGMAAHLCCCGPSYSDRVSAVCGKRHVESSARIRPLLHRDARYGLVSWLAHSRTASTQGIPERPLDFSHGVVGRKHPRVRIVVLATGCWRSQSARAARRSYGRSVSLPTDDARPKLQTRDGRAMLEPWVHGLPLLGLQHQYSLFSHRFSRAVAMGEGSDDGAGIDFLHHGRAACGTCRKYPLEHTSECVHRAYAVERDYKSPRHARNRSSVFGRSHGRSKITTFHDSEPLWVSSQSAKVTSEG
jgi:hypothetical protein